MKRLLLLLTLLTALTADTAQAQIGFGTTTPHPSAAVDVTSTTRGLLPPRMTSVQRRAIASPAAGLVVYDTDSLSLMLYNGAWIKMLIPAWSLRGNAGTTANDFLGTTDDQPLRLRVRNRTAGFIDPLKSNGTSSYNTSFGYQALNSSLTQTANTAIGFWALFDNAGSANTATGSEALRRNQSGISNTANGTGALINNISGNYNTGIGSTTLTRNNSGSYNTALGYHSLYDNRNGDHNTAIGVDAGVGDTALTFATAIGASAIVDTSYSLVLGSNYAPFLGIYENTRVGIGATKPKQRLHVNGQVMIDTLKSGGATDSIVTVDAAGVLRKRSAAAFIVGGGTNWGLTGNAGTTASNFIGTTDAQPLRFRVNNQPSGGIDATGQNAAFGAGALHAITTGTANIASGHQALNANTGGSSNTATGSYALQQNISGSQNTAVGRNALLQNTSGSNNTVVGAYADVNSGALINATAIGALARVDASNSMVLGSIAGVNNATTNTKVGIGTTTPQQTLHVKGTMRVDTLGAGTATDSVMTVDANGVLRKRNAAAFAGSGSTTYTAGSGISISGSNVITATDNSATNEIQNLVLTGNQLSLTGTSAQAINLPTFALPYSGSSSSGTNGVFSITSTGTTAAVEGTNNTAVAVNATTATGTALRGVATGAGTALYAQGAVKLKTTGAANGKFLMANDTNGTASWVNAPGSGTNYWTLNGADISNNNSGMVLLGTTSATTSGVLEVTKNLSMGSVAAIRGGTAGYMSVLNVSENGLSGNPAGCDVCTGSKAINAVSVYGDALFARATNGRGIYLKGGINTTPAMLIENNTGATTALEMSGKIKITDGTQGLNKVLTSDANGLASWQTISGGGTGIGGNLNAAYNYGGSGAGRTITASSGAVKVIGNDGLLVTGTYGSGATAEISGGGTRMFFNPRKAAFRAGMVSGTQWDDADLGDYSVALGYDARATGWYGTAIGSGTFASGTNAVAIGLNTVAGGIASVALGNGSGAGGNYSTALGNFTNAPGNYATAMGNQTGALSYGETAIGMFTTNYSPASTTSSVSTDRLFVIGNGIASVARSDAFTVFKSGNATLSGTLTQSSDRRLKRNIKPLENSLDKVLRLNGYRYQWNANLNKGDAQQIGFVAQEVEAIFPELVTTDANGMKSVAYQNVVPVLVEAIKELKAENEALKNSNASLKADNSALNSRSTDVEARLSQIEKLLNANTKLVKK